MTGRCSAGISWFSCLVRPIIASCFATAAYHIIEEHNSDYAAANFQEGNYLQVEVAARLANSPHPALAKQFMQFVTSPQFQQTLPTGNWMYPVINTPLPAGYQQLTVPKTALQFTPAEVAAHREAWISAWQNAVSH